MAAAKSISWRLAVYLLRQVCHPRGPGSVRKFGRTASASDEITLEAWKRGIPLGARLRRKSKELSDALLRCTDADAIPCNGRT